MDLLYKIKVAKMEYAVGDPLKGEDILNQIIAYLGRQQDKPSRRLKMERKADK